jgi:hypothetical protein
LIIYGVDQSLEFQIGGRNWSFSIQVMGKLIGRSFTAVQEVFQGHSRKNVRRGILNSIEDLSKTLYILNEGALLPLHYSQGLS